MRTRLAVLAGLLALTACGRPTGGVAGPAPDAPALPTDDAALVLRVALTGGFSTPSALLSRLPLVSVYRDGRVVTEGPVIAIYPPPAWPNVQVNQVDDATLTDLVQAAVDAGVGDAVDLGNPGIADATTTVLTLTTAEGTRTTEVYALGEAAGDPAVTPEQTAARAELAALVERLTGLPEDGRSEPFTPAAVVALAGEYAGDPELPRDAVTWPGPPLPGETVAPGTGCTVATGEQASAVVAAAQAADTLTPWTDGTATWSLAFRPLLPDETGCDDLTG
ncbi:hypothetical protein [Klenkia sp. PcliD-1-E]|uniref:hypothetical protein n=1 Tax=Klenkia sp. PcliD-1-E TaxID=2954492 RepID=UPI0020973B71|nr:hypothetical protein [Klenkia sp. PcliD-1-E]MCO7218451.1 hypothetical protein [Klenkia sp. PcliD-1-E]